MQRAGRLSVLVFAVCSTAASTSYAAERTNVLELTNGTTVAFSSSEYPSWEAANLIDGSSARGWCSANHAVFPHVVILELAQRHRITSIAIDNSNAQEKNYPGISAKDVIVYGSDTSATEGWTELLRLEAAKGARREEALPRPAIVGWLKFEITSNWGDKAYTETMELEAFGEPFGAAPEVNVAGTYATDAAGLMRLEQQGNRVWGCYDCCGFGELTGSLSGRVLRFEWREDNGTDFGATIMVLAASGDTLRGFYFRNGKLQGAWNGKREHKRQARCTLPRDDALAAKLAATGKAEVYGIYFDVDSAVIKPESEAALKEILALLQAQPALKLTVAGHTDAANTDAYNLKLSQQRAEAVVAWLVRHGVDAGRLAAKGFGESQPIADNATAAGRALNRRVEVLKQ